MFCVVSKLNLLAVDPVQRKLYYGYSNQFVSVNVNGTGNTNMFNTDGDYAWDVAIDVKKR